MICFLFIAYQLIARFKDVIDTLCLAVQSRRSR